MSGKNAKRARGILGATKFPDLIIEVVQPEIRRHNAANLPEKRYTVTADHKRRIQRLAQTEGISIEEAVLRYTKRVGMTPLTEDIKNELALKRPGH